MREQQIFFKHCALLAHAGADVHRQGQTRQRRKRLPIGGVEGERHQRGSGRDDFQSKLLGEAVAQVGSANFGNGQAACGHHHGLGLHFALAGLGGVRVGRCIAKLQALQAARLPTGDRAAHGTGITFAQQHVDQVLGAAVAKQLPLVFFVESDAVFVYQGHKVGSGVAAQSASGELRVLAQKMLVRRAWVDVAVGEIAATAARDTDFFCHLGAVVDQQHLQTLLCCHPRAKQPCGPRADDQHICLGHGWFKNASMCCANSAGWSWCIM